MKKVKRGTEAGVMKCWSDDEKIGVMECWSIGKTLGNGHWTLGKDREQNKTEQKNLSLRLKNEN